MTDADGQTHHLVTFGDVLQLPPDKAARFFTAFEAFSLRQIEGGEFSHLEWTDDQADTDKGGMPKTSIRLVWRF